MKIVTFNTWGTYGPPERQPVLEKAVREMGADLLCLQEVVTPDLPKTLSYPTTLHAPEPGLAILSRFPASDSRQITCEAVSPLEPYRRQALLARLEVEGPALWVINTHLAWKPDDGDTRLAQTEELLALAATLADPVLLAGDFNCGPGTAPLQKIGAAGFTDLFAALNPGRPGITWDNANPFIRSHTVQFPDRRIDCLFLKGATAGRLHPVSCEVVFRQPGAGGLHPSDHYGVLAVLQP